MVFQTCSEPFFIVFDLEESSHWNRQNWLFRVPYPTPKVVLQKDEMDTPFFQPPKMVGGFPASSDGQFFHPPQRTAKMQQRNSEPRRGGPEPPGCLNVPLEVSKWVMTYLYMGYNIVYYGYNPLTSHLLTSWDIQVGGSLVFSFFPRQRWRTWRMIDFLFQRHSRCGRWAKSLLFLG